MYVCCSSLRSAAASDGGLLCHHGCTNLHHGFTRVRSLTVCLDDCSVAVEQRWPGTRHRGCCGMHTLLYTSNGRRPTQQHAHSLALTHTQNGVVTCLGTDAACQPQVMMLMMLMRLHNFIAHKHTSLSLADSAELPNLLHSRRQHHCKCMCVCECVCVYVLACACVFLARVGVIV